MVRPLKIGVQLPEVERSVRWPELVDMAHAIEATGYDSLWVGDHLLYRDSAGSRGPWEAWSQLAALAAITSRVQLGPLVAAAAFHAPAMLAKKAATIDEISGGRLILGLGAGWNRVEFDAFGFPYDHRVSRFEEAFTIIKTLLRDGSIDFRGRFYEVRESELLPQPAQGRPPLMIGSQGPRMLAATLPHVDAWNGWYAWFGNNAEGLAPLLEKLDAACLDAGRQPDEISRSVGAEVSFEDSDTRERVFNQRYQPWKRQPPEKIADLLRTYAAMGIDHVQLVLDPITVESIEALAPVLAELDEAERTQTTSAGT